MSKPQVSLARRVHFSSGHRYFNPEFSEEKNKEVFGQCYSPHGHGHNYILEAYFKGAISPETGMIINLQDVDQILKDITHPLDHHFLNTDVEEFKNQVPTTENVSQYCYNKITEVLEKQKLKVDLQKVRLYEGEDLWVEYGDLN